MRGTLSLMAVVVAIAGCLAPLGPGACPGLETTSANFLLPMRLPPVPSWNWTLEEELPLHVHDPLLPWPGVDLEEVHFRRDFGGPVTLMTGGGGQVLLSYGDDIPWEGQNPTERAWFASFASRALNASSEQVAALTDEFGEVHQGGGPLSIYEVSFDRARLALDRLWNASAPKFERIGGSSGHGQWGECTGGLCMAGADVEWEFGWIHNADWSMAGTVTQVAVPSGTAMTMNGPFIQMTPWGAVQVTVPGRNATGVQEVARSWLESKGLPVPDTMQVAEYGCGKASDWPATTDVRDLNADAPIAGP